MEKILEFNFKDKKTGEVKNKGKIEIKNQTEEKAELYFYGDIVSDSWSSWWTDEDKCPQDVSDFLKELDNSKDIDIFINSGGGSVFAGIAIYSMLKRHNGKKVVHVDGLAASISSIIALAGDEVIIPKYATFMVHNPLLFLCGGYNANNLNEMISALNSCKESMLNIYMEHVKDGVTREEVSSFMDKETWFTGEEAEEYFNITIEDEFEVAACTSGLFDNYKNVPDKVLNKNIKNSNLKEKRVKDKENTNTNDEIENKEKINLLKAKLALKCKL